MLYSLLYKRFSNYIHIVNFSTITRKKKELGRDAIRKAKKKCIYMYSFTEISIISSCTVTNHGSSCIQTNIFILAPDMSQNVAEVTEKTREAIQKVIDSKLNSSRTVQKTSSKKETSYIKYTPSNAITNGRTGKRRIIKIVDKKADPMLMSEFKIKRAPEGPNDEEPVPILHKDTTTKLTKEQQRKWTIPPAISNWKNNKGFTISIDKRLASLSQDDNKFNMSDKFSVLTEALANAHDEAKAELKRKAELKHELERKKLLEDQHKLRRIAREAHMRRDFGNSGRNYINDKNSSSSFASRREMARRQRRQRAESELRMGSMSTESRVRMLARKEGREISDRVAIGVAASARGTNESDSYDSNLFLHAAGKSTRRGEEQVYEGSLFGAQDAVNDIYRARDSDKYKGLGMEAANKEISSLVKEKRFDDLSSSGPVSFEKARPSAEGEENKQQESKSGLHIKS